jgi:SAM-dependent methyltransferase
VAVTRLVRRRLLDPRDAEQAAEQPISDAVNIPFSELPDRVHELPPRDQELSVVGPAPLVQAVIAWLATIGRRGLAVEAPAAPKDERYEVGRLWPQLPGGAALELACGTGRDTVFMSSCGWDVTAVDVLPDALSRGRELAARYAAALRPIRWLQLDLEAEVAEFGRAFDLITVFRYLHRPLLGRLHDWLRPAGSILCETFTTVHRERYGKPSRAGHVLSPGELPKLLTGLEIRHHSEAWRGRAHTARAWAVLRRTA